MNRTSPVNMMSRNALLSRGVLKHLNLFDSDEEETLMSWQTVKKKHNRAKGSKGEATGVVDTAIRKSKKNSTRRGYLSNECRLPNTKSKDPDTPLNNFYPTTEGRRMYHGRIEFGYSPCVDLQTSHYRPQEHKAMRDNVRTKDAMDLKEKVELRVKNETKSTGLPLRRNLLKEFCEATTEENSIPSTSSQS